jgi:hypothetical protein
MLDELRKLAASLSPSDTPHSGEVQSVLGAVVKVLEHEGFKVAEELFPKADVGALAAAAGPALSTSQADALENLLSRLGAAVDELEGSAAGTDKPPAAAAPAPPAVAAELKAQIGDLEDSQPGEPAATPAAAAAEDPAATVAELQARIAELEREQGTAGDAQGPAVGTGPGSWALPTTTADAGAADTDPTP